MKQVLALLITALYVSSTHAQEEKSIVLNLGLGTITTPDVNNNKWGRFHSVGLDYYFTERHVLSSSLEYGNHRYFYESNTAGTVITKDGTNATQEYYAFAFLYKYKFLLKKNISASIGAGAAVIIDMITYHSKYSPVDGSLGGATEVSAIADLVIPVRLDAEYKLSRKFSVGLMGGIYSQPGYRTVAHYGSVKLGILLK